MFEGVDKPETERSLPPPQALIKLREIIISINNDVIKTWPEAYPNPIAIDKNK